MIKEMDGTVTISLKNWNELQQELERRENNIISLERTLKNANEKYEELYKKHWGFAV